MNRAGRARCCRFVHRCMGDLQIVRREGGTGGTRYGSNSSIGRLKRNTLPSPSRDPNQSSPP